jgi:hypothetical protein
MANSSNLAPSDTTLHRKKTAESSPRRARPELQENSRIDRLCIPRRAVIQPHPQALDSVFINFPNSAITKFPFGPEANGLSYYVVGSGLEIFNGDRSPFRIICSHLC